MKRITVTLVGLMLLSLVATAQPYEKKGKDILDVVAKKTATYKTMKIEFSYSVENKEGKASAAKEGIMLIKGDKYNLNIPGQNLICDGKTVWTYLKEAKEVQINSYDPNNEDALNPRKILTTYNSSHKPKFIKEAKDAAGKAVNIIDLEPLKGKSYYRIRLTIDKATNDLISSTIYQKSGDKFIYKIKKMTADIAVAETKFSFNKAEFPGVELIDMR